MPVAQLIRSYSPPPGVSLIASDFNSRGRLAAISKSDSGAVLVAIEDTAQSVPKEWLSRITRINWIDDGSLLLWPIPDWPVFGWGRTISFGKVGPHGATVLNLDRALHVFTDHSLIVCSKPEDSRELNPIVVYLSPAMSPIRSFSERFSEKEYREVLLEVERGVVDSGSAVFWFTGYDTEQLWCFEPFNREIITCPLGCPRVEIIALGCSGEKVIALRKRSADVFVRSYRRSDRSVDFESEEQLFISEELYRLFDNENALNPYASLFKGYAGSRFAVTTPERTVLFTV